MGRELKRVPMDFDYPLHKVWHGYLMNYISYCHDDGGNDGCKDCKKFAELKGVPTSSYGCPDYEKYFSEVMKKLDVLCDPPVGEGYQLWETTTEGSPVSPVFATLDELCEWCEDNATTFADMKATKEEWKQMFNDGYVCAKQGNVIFV